MDTHVHLMILGHSDDEHRDKAYAGRFRDEIMPLAVRGDVLSNIGLLSRVDVVIKNGVRAK
jgi:hypothetical protein